MQRFLDHIRSTLARHSGLAADALRLETPRDAALGDVAFPCFQLAKERKAPPPKIAQELAQALAGELEEVTVAAAGPYLNFTIDRTALAREVVTAIEDRGDRYGTSDEGAGRTILIDMSSPNIAKPMHVGHLRSTIIGAAVQRMHAALGYRTVTINHIGDWGSQFGKLVAAIQRWGDTVELEKEPIRALLALYVRYHEEEENDPALADEARAAFRELESGVEGEVRSTWKRLTELSMGEFNKIYARLGVDFDLVRGEAFYEPYLDATVERIQAAGVTEESDGALIVDLKSIKKNMAPCLLRKSDGTTLYATRDLAAAFHRQEEFGFERCLYVVGGEQKLHFQQLKGVLRRMGQEWEQAMEHVHFGLLRLPEGKLSTRKGQVIFLEDVLDQVVAEAGRIIAEKNPELANRDAVAEQVGIGAVIFNDLKRERARDVVFDMQDVLSFEGETGPYLQYTHARLASIERKAAGTAALDAQPDWTCLENASGILLRLARYPDVLRSAAAQAEPSELSTYLLALARELNSWYVHNRVLGVETAVSAARLRLIRASKSIVASGLQLLGIEVPEEM